MKTRARRRHYGPRAGVRILYSPKPNKTTNAWPDQDWDALQAAHDRTGHSQQDLIVFSTRHRRRFCEMTNALIDRLEPPKKQG